VTRFRWTTSPRRCGLAAWLVAAVIGVLAGGYFVASALAAPRVSYGNAAGDPPTFRVSGNLSSPLYPGATEPLDMTFTNPSSSAITIDSTDLTSSNISFGTNQPGCGSSNFQATGLGADVTIPADQFAPVSLSSLSVPQSDWPAITMIDTNANQDACEGAMLTLTYSGIEASGS
jgi:hypothetical protein